MCVCVCVCVCVREREGGGGVCALTHSVKLALLQLVGLSAVIVHIQHTRRSFFHQLNLHTHTHTHTHGKREISVVRTQTRVGIIC